MSQKLRGFVGQSMSGQRKALSPATYVFSSNASSSRAHTFAAPKSGWFRFVMWGPGGGQGSTAVGSGGALVVAERSLSKGQTVALVVGAGDYLTGSPVATTATFPNGEVLSAGPGVTGASSAGGVAVGKRELGDILVNGDPSTASPGAGASYGTQYIGGPGGAGPVGGFPGGGGAVPGTIAQGGNGVIFVSQVRLRP